MYFPQNGIRLSFVKTSEFQGGLNPPKPHPQYATGHHDRLSVVYNENFVIARIVLSTINFLMLCIWKCLTDSKGFSPALSL
jgi:hypothetical protein